MKVFTLFFVFVLANYYFCKKFGYEATRDLQLCPNDGADSGGGVPAAAG